MSSGCRTREDDEQIAAMGDSVQPLFDAGLVDLVEQRSCAHAGSETAAESGPHAGSCLCARLNREVTQR